MKIYPTITFDKFEDGIEALVDLTTVHPSMIPDYMTRNKNLTDGKELCPDCDGTGNYFFAMFKRCESCWGKGYVSGPPLERLYED